jgi:hypothetical protein
MERSVTQKRCGDQKMIERTDCSQPSRPHGQATQPVRFTHIAF